jgi:hypothetical protein
LPKDPTELQKKVFMNQAEISPEIALRQISAGGALEPFRRAVPTGSQPEAAETP